MNEFFTYDTLTSLGGIVAFVTLVTQIVKYYINVDPKWIALIASIVGQLSIQFLFIKDFSGNGIVLAIFNIFVVLASSIGAFEGIVKPIQRKIEK